MTREDMKKKKRELGYSNEQISRLSGVPLGTVQKFFGNKIQHPRYETLRAIEAVLYPEDGIASGRSFTHQSDDTAVGVSGHVDGIAPAGVSGHPDGVTPAGTTRHKVVYDCLTGQAISLVREPEGALDYRKDKLYPKAGEYTLEDYYALPDDVRAELIDGRFYIMEAPTYIHQMVLGELHLQFQQCIRTHNMPCLCFLSPCDVQLDKDEKTMLQPDLIIVCNRELIQKRVCYGAPDLVVEILSPSTRKKDMAVKFTKYCGAGVREYWIIDPDNEKVIVYSFEDDMLVSIYGRDDRVPVHISSGICDISFKEIWDAVQVLRQ